MRVTRDWATKAAERLYAEMDDIDGDAQQAGQSAQAPEAERERWVDSVAGIIRNEFSQCPDCGGRGHRWYTGIGDATCLACKGSGKR